MRPTTAKTPFWERIPHRIAVPLMLALTASLAVSSLRQDSITFDETKHFAAGLAHLKMGDFRFAPDTPPLAQMLVAAPALLMDHQWADQDAPGWRQGDVWPFGRHLLFAINDGDRWITPARYAMVVLLLATCLAVYAGARILFGRTASLLALLCACLSPTLLAHGRLVTTDLPITLAFITVLITYARLLGRITWGRLLCALVSIGALCLVKFSWPLVGPPLILMAAWAVARRRPIAFALWSSGGSDNVDDEGPEGAIGHRGGRMLVVGLVALLSLVSVYGAIWCCYGLRYAPSSGGDAAQVGLTAQGSRGREVATERQAAWDMTMRDSSGAPLRGPVADFVRWARNRRFLPEAYLFGLAFTRKTVEGQVTYSLGKIYDGGRLSYFPIAFAIKTPIAIILLLVAGIAAAWGPVRLRCRDSILMCGLVTFVVTYLAVVVCSDVNLGHRHLLPCYAPIMILCGRSAAWLSHRIARWMVLAAVVILAYTNISIYPQYLCYFNEVVGGPANGHRYLLDSNIDWGQDLKRLADFARRHPAEKIKLAYFGSADPRTYGIDCEMMPSQLGFGGTPAALTAGTYVVSVNQLYGLYTRQIRDSFWQRAINQQQYRAMSERFSQPPPDGLSDAQRAERDRMKQRFEEAQRWLLLNRLRRRVPDERIGWSMFVFRLSQDEVDSLLSLADYRAVDTSASE